MSGKVVNVDLSNKRSQNTIVLQNANPNILEVIENATHVVTYNFVGGKWEKGTCEGACFLTKNCMPPYNTVMILNKMGIENFAVDLDSIQNMKLHAPYVMVKYSTPAGGAKIVGLWFHDEREQHTFFKALEACKRNQSSGQQTPQTALAASTETKLNTKTGVLKGILSSLGGTSSAANADADADEATSVLVAAVRNGASESKTGAGASTGKKAEKAKGAVPASSSSSSGTSTSKRDGDASEALEDYFTSAIQQPRSQGKGKGNSSGAVALKSMLKKPPSIPEQQYEWVGDRLLPVAAKSTTAADAAFNTDKMLESLSETKYGRDEDMFTDRGISSVQARAAFEVPEGIDGNVAVNANNSYLEATKASAKKESSIPAHHLQAGGVGSSFYFADSPGAVTPTPTPPLETNVSTGTKTSLLKTVLSFGSLNTGASSTAVNPSSIVHASSTGSLSAIAAPPDTDAATPRAPQQSRKNSSFLSPSDLMKMVKKR